MNEKTQNTATTASDRHEVNVVCSSCDIGCPLVAEVENNKVVNVRTHDHPALKDYICMKGALAHKGFNHPDRIQKPLKRVGERGSGKWQEVSWEEAMDDIAARLKTVVAQYGPEALAVATSQWNTSVDNGMGRRFMNLLGSPNWISGVALCAGNTSAVNRMVYGWFPQPDYSKTQCIVLFGHNPGQHRWAPVHHKIVRAQEKGAKLIVLDPRRSECAERADIWLPLRPGTDAAMCLGWLNVIIEEQLYDKNFVENWTVGFEALCERVKEYPVDKVAEITGVDADLIREAARMYATATPGIIPWTPITDQQLNSTSAIRLHSILRAVTGSLDVPGGEVLHGFHPSIISEDELEMHEALSQTQKDKQLGAADHPAFTYRGMEPLREPTERVWGKPYANLITGNFMAVPSATFRAMADADPYPVKAFISLGNNSLLGYSNMDLLMRAMDNQDLVVVHEHIMTPTAQMADYVLPGDSWLERPQLYDALGWVSTIGISNQAAEPPGECKSVFHFWRELALRMGFEEHFPWQSLEQLYDYRLSPLGVSYQDFAANNMAHGPKLAFKKYEKTGFATPSGKVELSSSVLEGFGFDPLPSYREAPGPCEQYPLMLFMGVRDDEYFQTGHRHIPELRERKPEPTIYLNPETATELALTATDWVSVTTKGGSVAGLVEIREDMPAGLVRVPHGWWKPETQQGREHLSGALIYSDSLITIDEPEYRDPEQGIPHLRGIPCRIEKLVGKPL
jgi:anaerobic selenocysteine-containing dehydrogenase